MILVIGDIMLDAYIFGISDRISPEAPVPILDYTNSSSYLGGAANVANILSDLDCDVSLIGVIGDDDAGTKIEGIIKNTKIEPILIIDKSRPTTVKTRFISMDQQLLRVDRESTHNINEDVESNIMDVLIDTIDKKSVSSIIASDYRKGVVNKTICRLVRKICKERSIKFVVDPKGESWRKYGYMDVITPNKNELFSISKMIVDRKKLEKSEI